MLRAAARAFGGPELHERVHVAGPREQRLAALAHPLLLGTSRSSSFFLQSTQPIPPCGSSVPS